MKLTTHVAQTTHPMLSWNTDPAKIRGAVKLRGADPSDLYSINNLIAAAIGTWNLADRVKRISLPLYRYHEDDLREMQIVAPIAAMTRSSASSPSSKLTRATFSTDCRPRYCTGYTWRRVSIAGVQAPA